MLKRSTLKCSSSSVMELPSAGMEALHTQSGEMEKVFQRSFDRFLEAIHPASP